LSRPLGLVAAGHPATAAAMAGVLRDGGNAVDAAVAGVLAAAVAEPCLTSPAGGGFLMVRTAAGEEVVLDCFVAAPGLGAGPADPAGLECVPVHFGHAVQDFHVGAASVATPGVLTGCLEAHERWGRLDLDRVVAPAVALARHGVEVNAFLAQLVGLLMPILARTATGRALFFRDEGPLRVGDRFTNPGLAQFLSEVGAGVRHRFRADELGGAVTATDLASYRVVPRPPRRTTYRGS
jgi:gamma-glutamyltranspeptidase / glutathione hydrolase